jgi:hypothetical protein
MISRAGGILYEGFSKPKQQGLAHWLEKADKKNGGSYDTHDVEGMKYMTKLVPFLGVMIPFWGIYGQTKTAFQIQGCQVCYYYAIIMIIFYDYEISINVLFHRCDS